MSIGKFEKTNIFDIVYDWMTYSIFFSKPLEIFFPSLNVFEKVGNGYGGFSKSFFERGTDCTMCGNCCFGKQQVWQWLPSENSPKDVQELEYTVNNNSIKVKIHVNKKNCSKEGCDYLIPIGNEIHPITKKPILGCSLHEKGQKPIHCSQLPQILSYPVKIKNTNNLHLLSKRLPGRNWRTPQCPIDVYNLKISDNEIEKDRKLLQTWCKSFGHLDNCNILEFYDLWERVIEKISKEDVILQKNVLFNEYMLDKENYINFLFDFK